MTTERQIQRLGVVTLMTLVAASGLAIAQSQSPVARAGNPVIQGWYADPEAHVFAEPKGEQRQGGGWLRGLAGGLGDGCSVAHVGCRSVVRSLVQLDGRGPVISAVRWSGWGKSELAAV